MSHAKTVLEKVREFVAKYYGVEIGLVTPETDLDETLEGKSNEYIDCWEFMYYLGKEFNIEIPMQEIGTIEQTAEYIGKHCN